MEIIQIQMKKWNIQIKSENFVAQFCSEIKYKKKKLTTCLNAPSATSKSSLIKS